MKTTFIILASLIWLSQATYAKITLPELVSNGMILQRNQRIAVWGWADNQEKITINFKNKTYTTTTGANKEWKIWLPSMSAGGPFTMSIKGSNQILIKNILIGDVWLCSGQSNMEYVLKRSEIIYADEIAHANNDQIRQFAVKPNWSYTVVTNVKSNGWEPVTPQNVLKFTAVGYFFAKSLYAKYHVPIGLINSTYGGTPIQSWMSEDALIKFPDLLNQFDEYRDTAKVNTILQENKAVTTNWYSTVVKTDTGRNNLTGQPVWAGNNIDFSSWSQIQVPGFWQDQKLKNLNGVVWYKKQVVLSSAYVGKQGILELGNIFSEDTTYFNGVKIGSTSSQYLARRYTVPAGLIRPGNNIITVRVLNKEGSGGFLKDKPYKLTIDGTGISLSGEWICKVGANMLPLLSAGIKQFSREPAVLYNAMIAPLKSYTIKGVIWYQGENNTSAAKKYTALFPALINDWRKKWQQKNLPFIYVQLASYMPVIDHPSDSQWAELREAQTTALKLPNTGMAVIHDTGEWNDVHPINKKDVGERLSLAARHVAYNEDKVIYSGPIFQSAKVIENKMVITFNDFGSELVVKGGGELNHFAIAGSDKKFIWARAVIKNNCIIVWNDSVSKPIAVRYAWANNPQGANLYNKNGLPASSFRTDSWDKSFFDNAK
ncbi:MAG: sialate O-acetylesterase [Sphingobacteriaceae bacterium]|nr:MAG: sialate O-acetylesterase [Sphingobacteriaceae bacterium]